MENSPPGTHAMSEGRGCGLGAELTTLAQTAVAKAWDSRALRTSAGAEHSPANDYSRELPAANNKSHPIRG